MRLRNIYGTMKSADIDEFYVGFFVGESFGVTIYKRFRSRGSETDRIFVCDALSRIRSRNIGATSASTCCTFFQFEPALKMNGPPSKFRRAY